MLSREARVEGKGGKTEYIHAMLAASATVTDGRRREMGDMGDRSRPGPGLNQWQMVCSNLWGKQQKNVLGGGLSPSG
jgi:hypothetical protein